jgi:RNA polymerase sigma-70 factor (ECF subfamily)
MQFALASDDADRRSLDDEAALIREAQLDRTAFGPLYERYVDRVFAYLRSRTASDQDAADLTQQVFVQALDALPRYRPRGAPFVAWLLRIARNAAINFHKRHRQTLTWDLLPHGLQPVGGEDVGIRVEQRDTLERLFVQLSPDNREILILRFAADLTVAEIAAVLGKSEAATRMRLVRALRSLREHYHDHSN